MAGEDIELLTAARMFFIKHWRLPEFCSCFNFLFAGPCDSHIQVSSDEHLGISTYLCESPRLETDALPQVLTLRHLLKLVTERATAAMAFFGLENDAQHCSTIFGAIFKYFLDKLSEIYMYLCFFLLTSAGRWVWGNLGRTIRPSWVDMFGVFQFWWVFFSTLYRDRPVICT